MAGIISPELRRRLQEEGYTRLVYIEGRGICGLMRFVFTTGLVYGITLYRYDGRYCYENFADADEALKSWDGKSDPQDENWIKHKGKTEYSNPLKLKD